MKKRGLTLVELTVAMGIFIVVLTISLGIIVDIFKLQRKNIIIREVQQNARIGMELISKEARAADTLTISSDTMTIGYKDPASGVVVTTVVYTHSGDKITRTEGSYPTYSITSDNINISSLTFSLSGKILNISLTAEDKGATDPANQDEITITESVYVEGLDL